MWHMSSLSFSSLSLLLKKYLNLQILKRDKGYVAFSQNLYMYFNIVVSQNTQYTNFKIQYDFCTKLFSSNKYWTKYCKYFFSI